MTDLLGRIRRLPPVLRDLVGAIAALSEEEIAQLTAALPRNIGCIEAHFDTARISLFVRAKATERVRAELQRDLMSE